MRFKKSSSDSGKRRSRRLLPALLSRLSPLLMDPTEDPDDRTSDGVREEPPEEPDDDPLLSANAGVVEMRPIVADRAMTAPASFLKRDIDFNLTLVPDPCGHIPFHTGVSGAGRSHSGLVSAQPAAETICNLITVRLGVRVQEVLGVWTVICFLPYPV